MLRSLNFFADFLDLRLAHFAGYRKEMRHSLTVSPKKSSAKKILMLASQELHPS